MTMIRFTIVTVTYNAEKTFEATANSVLSQTYQHVEHIIVDGASTDGTLQRVESYRKQSNRHASHHEVIVISEPDQGIYDAMNKGLRRASGDYIVFLNAGDAFPLSNTLEHISQKINQEEELPGVLYGDTDLIDDNGNFVAHRRLRPPARLSWRSFLRGMLVCHQAFYARRDIAQSTPYDLYFRFSADVDWCIRIMKTARHQQLSMQNLHEVVANYLNEGQTTLNHRASLKERFEVMRRHYGLIPTIFMHGWFVVRRVFLH